MEGKMGGLPTLEELEEMSRVDVRTVEKDSLVDIADIRIDPSLPQKERIMDYLRQIKNPYCYLSNGTVIKVSFAGKTTLEECMARYCRSKMAQEGEAKRA